MDEKILFIEYARMAVVIFIFVFVTVKLVMKKRLLTRLAFSEKTNKKINVVMIPIVYALLLYLLYFYCPILLDIPICMSGNYCYAEAISISNDYSNENYIEKRSVNMEIDGNIKHMYLYSNGIREGERYLLVYLPHSNIGQAVSKNGVSDPKAGDK